MESSKRSALTPLFHGHRDIRVVIDSVLEGRLGSVVTDDAASPSVARLGYLPARVCPLLCVH